MAVSTLELVPRPGPHAHAAPTGLRWRMAITAVVAVAALGAIERAHGQTDQASTPLFADDAALALTIEGPFRTLSRNRDDDTELDGLLTYRADDGAEVTLDLQIRTRGNSRLDICTYPPLRLNFRRRQVEGTVFAGQNTIKLVTLCRDQTAYRDYLALEYESYRIYNAVSDLSYRVRWADIEYIDTDERGAPPETRPAFFLEEDSEVAARTGLEVWRVEQIPLRSLDPATTALLSLFQYLIGNTDWAATAGPPGDRCCHNGDVLRKTDGLAVVIPYDFDQAGLIDAEYAEPPRSLPIRSVRQRLYRGYCRFNDALDAAVERFNVTRPEIEAVIAGAQIREDARNRAQAYVESFYEIVNDPDERLEEIDLACRGQRP